jgi:hypothetical protein
MSMNALKNLAIAAVLLAAQAVTAAVPPPPISIATVGYTVTATGLTPGGACAVIVSWRVQGAGMSGTVETWREARADADGTVAMQFRVPAPAGGLIAVVDVTTGRLEVSAGDGSTFERVDLPPDRLKRNGQRDVEEVTSPKTRAMIVVARRDQGVWVQRANDGARGDADRKINGKILTDPAAMTPIGDSSPPPAKIRPHDAVLIVDLKGGTYASTEVTP